MPPAAPPVPPVPGWGSRQVPLPLPRQQHSISILPACALPAAPPLCLGPLLSSLDHAICCYLRVFFPEPPPSKLCSPEVGVSFARVSSGRLPCPPFTLMPSSFSFWGYAASCLLGQGLSGVFLLQEPPFSLTLLLLWPGLHHHPPFFLFSGQTRSTHLFLALGCLSVLWSPCILCPDPLLWIRAAPPSHRVCLVSQPLSCHLLKRSRAGLLLSVHNLGPSAFSRCSDRCLRASCVPESGPP